jgi:hypothetical protein
MRHQNQIVFKGRRKWGVFIPFMGLFIATAFLLGLQTLELALLILILYYIAWATHKEQA